MMRSLYILLLVGLFWSACKNDSANNTTDPAQPAATPVKVPSFNADSAYQHVVTQVAFGPRVTNSTAHQQCAEWLVAKFKSYGAQVVEQRFTAKAFDGTSLNGVNIIARYNPGSSRRIFLSAHWDTRPFADSPLSTERQNEAILGADDGGSGVAVLLEIARQLQANPVDIGIDLVLFDAEDYGKSDDTPESAYTYGLGSQYWAKNLPEPGYRPSYGILLDMVGAKNARFSKEEISRRAAGRVLDKIWKLAQAMGYGNLFVNDHAGGVTDDHYFVIEGAGIPMIDIINLPPDDPKTPFGDHWHTHNDNLDIIDKRTLRAVGQVMLAVIYRESGGTL